MWGTDSTKDMLVRIHDVKSGQAKAKKDAQRTEASQIF